MIRLDLLPVISECNDNRECVTFNLLNCEIYEEKYLKDGVYNQRCMI